ncbi:hypothetical protein DXG03_004848 [Asterophora parasitica]|uniref:Pet127-domain-containing protein n=1 Tax=Asterophora parasitica TaxID=117018 RepID=A0A9P7GDY1_9AGAR|nr:hypothetical protein DXG03_004848 [Asterophora parasitica]
MSLWTSASHRASTCLASGVAGPSSSAASTSTRIFRRAVSTTSAESKPKNWQKKKAKLLSQRLTEAQTELSTLPEREKTLLKALRSVFETSKSTRPGKRPRVKAAPPKLKHDLAYPSFDISKVLRGARARQALPLLNAETGWGEDKLRPPSPQPPAPQPPAPQPPAPQPPASQPTRREEPHHAVDTSKEVEDNIFGQRERSKSWAVRESTRPPHMQSPLIYSRRIEGLLESSTSEGPAALQDVEPRSAHNPIATLAHGLDRVLFNPGVHWLQDPRSRVYNFPPYLENIPKVTDFAFERLGGFIKSSRDDDLWDLARREKCTFAGSTSSLSGMLSHVYFLLSGDKDVNTDNLSRHFGKEPRSFTAGQRMPASVVFNHNDGVYAIDSSSDKDGDANKNILTWMGTLLEKYLTVSPEEFAGFMRWNPAPEGLQTESQLRDAYRYAKSDRIVMRSQLDCVDPRLPGTGVFDIKTRACLPIRMDLLNFEENSGYLIRSQTGRVESFEREYYDLIRSAFLKYSFQVRIGNMDGVIVAYHNTAQMFGFQYISLAEMDEALFGTGPGVGDRVFAKCVGVLEQVAEEVVGCFPGETVKATFEKLEGKDVMNVWVQPVEWDGAAEDRPIRQLEVKISNYLSEDPVRGSTAVSSCADQPWTAHWSVARLSCSGTGEEESRRALQGAKDRQFRYYDIPTGWDPESVSEFWSGLSFNGQPPEDAGKFTPSNFRVAGKRTQLLRSMARSGREETVRIRNEEAGRKKVWLGGETDEVVEPWPEDVIHVARKEAQSVGDGEGVEEIVAAERILDLATDDASASLEEPIERRE